MKPNSRIDNFLAKIAGDPDANEAMEPRSPEEYYLDQIAKNGGSGGGVLVVGVDMQTFTLDKTWQEIYDANLAVMVNKGEDGNSWSIFQSAYIDNENYEVVVSGEVPITFRASSADGYPVAQMG